MYLNAADSFSKKYFEIEKCKMTRERERKKNKRASEREGVNIILSIIARHI